MSAQADKATVIVTRFGPTGRATSARYFREFERGDAAAYALKLERAGVAHKLAEVAR